MLLCLPDLFICSRRWRDTEFVSSTYDMTRVPSLGRSHIHSHINRQGLKFIEAHFMCHSMDFVGNSNLAYSNTHLKTVLLFHTELRILICVCMCLKCQMTQRSEKSTNISFTYKQSRMFKSQSEEGPSTLRYLTASNCAIC